MQFSLETRTVSLSVGEFAGFSLGPVDSSGGPQGIWRAQLGQHWHHELQKRTLAEAPAAQFEVVIDGRITHRGWTFALNGRIDQLVGDTLREIKSVMRPLPAEETDLRTDYPAYFLQLAAYAVLRRALGAKQTKAELIFVEAGSGLAQTIALTAFDEALVHHQLDALVEFLNLRLRATERRRSLCFHPAFSSLRPGQETIQQDLSSVLSPPSSVLLFEAPTGYGKTGCVLEFALGQMKAGRFARLIWLTGKSTGQIQVMHTLSQMTAQNFCNLIGYKGSLPFWQVRNKSEHCVNHTFHCVRDGCDYLKDCADRWPGSGLAKFYLDDRQPRDLDTLRTAGREARICPYEITRASLAFNDVWIGDFNYVFAPDNCGLFFNQPGFDPAETLLVELPSFRVIARAGALRDFTADPDEHRAVFTSDAAFVALETVDGMVVIATASGQRVRHRLPAVATLVGTDGERSAFVYRPSGERYGGEYRLFDPREPMAPPQPVDSAANYRVMTSFDVDCSNGVDAVLDRHTLQPIALGPCAPVGGNYIHVGTGSAFALFHDSAVELRDSTGTDRVVLRSVITPPAEGTNDAATAFPFAHDTSGRSYFSGSEPSVRVRRAGDARTAELQTPRADPALLETLGRLLGAP